MNVVDIVEKWTLLQVEEIFYTAFNNNITKHRKCFKKQEDTQTSVFRMKENCKIIEPTMVIVPKDVKIIYSLQNKRKVSDKTNQM